MNTGFKSQCVPSYQILTEEQIKEIELMRQGNLFSID